MSDENTHAVPDSSQEPEQRRNIEPKAAENSADSEIIQPEPHRRKRNYVPKTPQECERSKILKRGSTPLRERFMSDMQYNTLSKATQKNYLNAVFDFIAHYYKSPEKISDEEIREYFNYEINVRHLSTYSLMVHRAALLFLYEKTLNLSRPFLHIFHPRTQSFFSLERLLPFCEERQETQGDSVATCFPSVRFVKRPTILFFSGKVHAAQAPQHRQDG